LRELARHARAGSAALYALLVHDWSKIDYVGHTSKTDQVRLSNARDYDQGNESWLNPPVTSQVSRTGQDHSSHGSV